MSLMQTSNGRDLKVLKEVKEQKESAEFGKSDQSEHDMV